MGGALEDCGGIVRILLLSGTLERVVLVENQGERPASVYIRVYKYRRRYSIIKRCTGICTSLPKSPGA